MAKRKRTHGLLTVSNKGLIKSDDWFRRSSENVRDSKQEADRPKWLNFRELENGEAEILVYGAITQYPWFDNEKSASELYKELSQINADTIHLRINSPGGEVIEAVAMFNLLKESGAKIITHIDGEASSSAGWLAMAGDEVIMGEASRLMIHRATMMTYGDADELRASADVMEGLEDSILKIFQKKTGLPNEELREMMNGETWLTPEEALEKGFADSIAEMGEEEEETNQPTNKAKPKVENKSEGEEPDEKAAREQRLRNHKRLLELKERELLAN